jgi:hypothetical protein
MRHVSPVLLLGLAGCFPASAQALLTIDVENYVPYHNDMADPAVFASIPNTTEGTVRVFQRFVFIGDIVAVNGQPAKGIRTARATNVLLSPTPLRNRASRMRCEQISSRCILT